MRRLPSSRRRRDEQGVIAIAVALMTCFVVLPMGALAVDIGIQRVARTDLQSVADVIALDLARKLDGSRTAAEWSSASPTIQQVAAESLARNSSGVGEGAAVTAVLGKLETTGTFTELPSTSTEVPNAVHVTTSTSVNFVLKPGSGGTTRTALAQAETVGCFQLGSFAASITPAAAPLFKDLLAPLLGSTTLNAVGYNGLASARLSLLELIRTSYIGVGTVDELLAMNDLTVADVYRASAQVLAARGLAAQAAVFNTAATSVVAAITIRAGDLFGLTNASDAALQSQFNALDLLVGAAFLANGTNLLDIANLQTSLASVGVTTSSLQIIERAQRACSREEAKTAQLKFRSQAKLLVENSPLINANGAQLRMVDASGNNSNDVMLGLDVDLAGARGRLTSLACNPDVFDVDVWTDLAKANLSGIAQVAGSVKTTVMGVAGTTVPIKFSIQVIADASKPATVAPAHGQLAVPPRTYADWVEVGSGNHVLPHVTVSVVPGSLEIVGNVTVSVLGLPVIVPTGDLLATVTPIITPLVAGLGAPTAKIGSVANPLVDKVNGIIAQLSTGLGLNVGGADVYGVPHPECQSPVLRG